MAFVGGFLGGGVEMVPSGSGQLFLQWVIPDGEEVGDATFEAIEVGGTGSHSIPVGSDGRATMLVPTGIYEVSIDHSEDYDYDGPQRVVVESTQSYLVLFLPIMEGVSAALLKTTYESFGVTGYKVTNSRGSIVAQGDAWFRENLFVLAKDTYTVELSSASTTLSKTFQVTYPGINEIVLDELFCIVTIDEKSVYPGTTYKLNETAVSAHFETFLDSSSYTLNYSSPEYKENYPITAIDEFSFKSTDATLTIQPISVGVVTVFSSKTTQRFLKGTYKVLVIGGGGGGGSGAESSYFIVGGGGGGGGRVSEGIISLEEDMDIEIICGSGATRGSSGGASSFGTYLSASGGDSGGSGSISDGDTLMAYGGKGGAGGSGGGGGGAYFTYSNTGGKIIKGGAGGDAEYGGGGGGGNGVYLGGNGVSGGEGAGGAGGTHGGKGGRAEYGGGGGEATSDEFFGVCAANGGSSNSNLGGGGGGGRGAEGGQGYVQGGGGGGGVSGGKGGYIAYNSAKYDRYRGTGYGGGGRGAEGNSSYYAGGGGGGGYGESPAPFNTTSGCSGCVVIQWVSL